MSSRVWDHTDHQMEINLNQTAMHSENPLKGTKTQILDSSTDFLLSNNLQNVHEIMQIETSKFGDISFLNKDTFHVDLKVQNGGVLQPRECISSLTSSSNLHPSDQCSSSEHSPSPDIIPLKGVQTLTASHEMEPGEKDEPVLPIYTAVPIHNSQPQLQWANLFGELGIEYRVDSTEIEDNQQYQPGKIIGGNESALESLAKDHVAGKLKNGTHGVITNPKYNFLWNPSLAIEKTKILGRGGNGTVELCRFGDVEFVTKTIFRDFRRNEVLFTNKLSHEFIVRSYGLIIRNGIPQMIMDYAGENLLKYGLSKSVEEKEIWDITYQLLEALSYLHSHQIRHFDVKPENIVLKDDGTGHRNLKLADFGGATHFNEEVDCMSWTPAYMSPEMDQLYLLKQFPNQRMFKTTCGEITEKCDVYSLALSILFLYLRGHALIKHVTKGFHAMVGQEKADAVSIQIVISNAKNPSIGETLIPPNVGSGMRSVLDGMLRGSVVDRLTANQAMELMKELSPSRSEKENTPEPERVMLLQSRPSTEKKEMFSQAVQTTRAKPRSSKIIVVKMKPAAKKIQLNGIDNFPINNTLETEEHQRPLKDLNIDLQLRLMQEQVENEKDEGLRKVIEEENQPLLKRLVKRKLVNKINSEKAFKMTKIMDTLENESSNSGELQRTNRPVVKQQSQVVMTSPEPVEQGPLFEGPGNLPNFDILDF